jgi:hypothetical protein
MHQIKAINARTEKSAFGRLSLTLLSASTDGLGILMADACGVLCSCETGQAQVFLSLSPGRNPETSVSLDLCVGSGATAPAGLQWNSSLAAKPDHRNRCDSWLPWPLVASRR